MMMSNERKDTNIPNMFVYNGPGNVTLTNLDATGYYATLLKVSVAFADGIFPS